MEKAEQREFQIDDWSVKDLQSLFDDPTSEKQLQTRATVAIENAAKQGDTALASFLRRAVTKLRSSSVGTRNDPTWTTQLSAAAAAAMGSEYYPDAGRNVTVTGPARDNTTKILTNEEIKNTRAPAERGALNQQTVFSSEANQGTINPILRQEYERILVVDSKYRPTIFPHPQHPRTASSTTNFHANVSEVLHNVVSLKLQSITIPRVWNNFSSAIGNTVIGVCVTTAGKHDTVLWYYVDNQYFNPEYTVPVPVQTLCIMPFDRMNKYSFGLRMKSIDPESRKVELEIECPDGDCTELTFKLVVFASDMPAHPHESCRTNATVNGNLATSLGFAGLESSPDPKDANSFIIYGKSFSSGLLTATGDMPLDPHPLRYFLVVLDDFNTNRINNSLVGIAGADSKIPPPLSLPVEIIDGGCHYNPTNKTRTQLYAANVKLHSLDIADTSNSEPCPSNVLALCPVPGKQGTFGEILTLTGTGVNSTERAYFGPIDLQKIHVKLLDNAGNYVDLQGRNWSMSLIVTQLYQY